MPASFSTLFIGRTLLGLYFILPGFAKIINPEPHLALMLHHHIPFGPYLLPIAVLANLVIGGLLLFNVSPHLASLAGVGYIIVINLTLHDFWNFSGIEQAHETQNFVKNLAIAAGLLILADS